MWPRGSGKARGWQVWAVWELVRRSLLRVAGADSSIGGGLFPPGWATAWLTDSQLCGSGILSQAPGFIKHYQNPSVFKTHRNSSGEGCEGPLGPPSGTLSPLNTCSAVQSWPCRVLIRNRALPAEPTQNPSARSWTRVGTELSSNLKLEPKV